MIIMLYVQTLISILHGMTWYEQQGMENTNTNTIPHCS
jgi:hypothetical protein